VCNYVYSSNPADLFAMFKTAYANSFAEDIEIDLNNITVLDYFSMIGDAHIVSITSSYLETACPNDVYHEAIEGMQFRYDNATGVYGTHKVYIIYNEVLYTAESAYEERIIDFDGLCKIFGLHTTKTATFNQTSYNQLKSFLEKTILENLIYTNLESITACIMAIWQFPIAT